MSEDIVRLPSETGMIFATEIFRGLDKNGKEMVAFEINDESLDDLDNYQTKGWCSANEWEQYKYMR